MIKKSLSAIGGILVVAAIPLAFTQSGWAMVSFIVGLFLVDNFGTIEENGCDF